MTCVAKCVAPSRDCTIIRAPGRRKRNSVARPGERRAPLERSTMTRRRFERVILIVMDSVGIGEMPDAARFGDAGSDTLGHVLASRPLALDHLAALGLAN